MTGITYSCFLCHNMDIHVIIYMYVDIRVIIHVHCYSAYKRLFDRFYNNVCSQAIDPFCENGVISESVKIMLNSLQLVLVCIFTSSMILI